MFEGCSAPRTDFTAEMSVDDAIRLIHQSAPPPRRELIALHQAHNRILFADITASRDQPPFDAAAMDGYAVNDIPSETNSLIVIGESQAGRAFEGEAKAGQAVRIFTGAPVPSGTTRVIMQENTQRTGDHLTLRTRPEGKSHIRPQGSDFRKGDVLLAAGERLDALRLSIVAAVGAARIVVCRKPRVALLCTGDELVRAGDNPRADQVYESNSFALKAMIENWGGKAVIAHVDDNREAITKTLQTLKADLIITIGGASVGDYDLVKPALSAMGIDWLFDKVNIRPGRPTAFGRLTDGRCVLSLPGNPAAALICAQLFAQPFIGGMLGQPPQQRFATLPLAAPLAANGPRETWLRARIIYSASGALTVLPLNNQDSSAVAAFTQTDALVRREPDAIITPAGEFVNCIIIGPTSALGL